MPRYLVKVNGKPQSLNVDADTPLLSGLRDDLALKVPKFGCGLSQCGACIVRVDGVAQRSCLLPISMLSGKSVTSLEGLDSSQPGKLSKPLLMSRPHSVASGITTHRRRRQARSHGLGRP